jgi:hypothetical protein
MAPTAPAKKATPAATKNTSKVCNLSRSPLSANSTPQTARDTHRQPSIEVVDDDDDLRPHKAVPVNPSHILELADGSDDDDDMPGLQTVDDSEDSDDEDSSDDEGPGESAEAELSALSSQSISKKIINNVLERLSKDWNSPIYVFFKPMPSIEYIKERRVHVFECDAKHCKGKGNGRMVRRYLDTTDAKSTGNLRKHAKICWGDDVVTAADATRDVLAAREALGKMKLKDGSILEAFQRVAKSKVTYSHRQHTTTESRYISICTALGGLELI